MFFFTFFSFPVKSSYLCCLWKRSWRWLQKRVVFSYLYGKKNIPVSWLFFLSVYMKLFNPSKQDILVTRSTPREKPNCFWLQTKMAAVSQNIMAQTNFMIPSPSFLSIGHMYGLLVLWKMKIKQTENNIMLYFLQRRNYRRSKVKLRKIVNLYHKRRSCW